MALRKIREMGDPILEKTCKEVKEMTPRTLDLIDDMFDTYKPDIVVNLAALILTFVTVGSTVFSFAED